MTSYDRESFARNMARAAELDARKVRIRHLNDQLRMTGIGGRVMITAGIQGLPRKALRLLTEAMVRQTEFHPENDPHDEHDFGSMEADGIRAFWKIDCYDKQLEYGSPDPSDPAVTARVLTIMLAEEW